MVNVNTIHVHDKIVVINRSNQLGKLSPDQILSVCG